MSKIIVFVAFFFLAVALCFAEGNITSNDAMRIDTYNAGHWRLVYLPIGTEKSLGRSNDLFK